MSLVLTNSGSGRDDALEHIRSNKGYRYATLEEYRAAGQMPTSLSTLDEMAQLHPGIRVGNDGAKHADELLNQLQSE